MRPENVRLNGKYQIQDNADISLENIYLGVDAKMFYEGLLVRVTAKPTEPWKGHQIFTVEFIGYNPNNWRKWKIGGTIWLLARHLKPVACPWREARTAISSSLQEAS